MPNSFYDQVRGQTAVTALHTSLCAEAFGDLIGSAFDFSPLAHSDLESFYHAQQWYTEDCIFSQTRSHGFAMSRRQSHIHNMGHLVLFSRLLNGRSRGICGADIIDRSPGVIYVSDQAVPFDALVDAHTIQSLYIPKSVLGFDPDAKPNNLAIHPTSSIGKLVHAGFDDAFATLSKDAGFVPTAMLNRLLACLKVVLGANPQRDDIRVHAREALSRQIKRHIENNLSDPDLSTDSILSQFGISRAGLYRMFETNGGVRRYIMRRRTVRALIDLSQSPFRRGNIARASERWGFINHPTFNRVVQRIYHASPGRLFAGELPQSRDMGRQVASFSHHTARTAASV